MHIMISGQLSEMMVYLLKLFPTYPQMKGRTRGLYENFCSSCGGLDNTSNEGGDNLMEKGED